MSRDCFIGDQWSRGSSGEIHTVLSPATGVGIGRVTFGDQRDIDAAVQAARDAFDAWAGRSVFERAAILHAAARLLRRRKSSVARMIAREQGKPLWAEAIVEVEWAAAQLDEAAEWATRLEGTILPSASAVKRVLVHRRPRGVCGVITPWNFPLLIPTEYLGPALATGNTVVWTPAPSVVLSGTMLARCLLEAGLPRGVLNFVPGTGGIVGDALAGHPDVQSIALTGSSQTGVLVARRAAGKTQILELGGNGPTIVLADADLELAARVVALAAFGNAGQTCSATERVLVHQSVQSRFVELVTAAALEVVVGDPLAPETTMGPLHNEAVAAKMDHHVAQAVSSGARVIVGGARVPGHPTNLFYSPTVLDDVDPNSLIASEETFGPVVPVIGFSEPDEALAVVRASSYGLIAAVFGRDLGAAMAIAEQMPAGIVNVNDSSDYWELHIPFGGAAGTRSGVGRIGGRFITEELTETRTIILDTGVRASAPR